MSDDDEMEGLRNELFRDPKVKIGKDVRRDRIRDLNDAFRRSGDGGRVLFTAGVSNLGVAFSHLALGLVRRFDKFDADNDPHGEHDFGAVELQGHKLFWKIDYYDKALEYGSDDAADPDQTTRALTVMLAEEY
jgi:Protein of unknown function (DUF3768)